MIQMKELMTCKCERCGHEWIPRDQHRLPIVCASGKCKSAYWNQPRIYSTKAHPLPVVADVEVAG